MIYLDARAPEQRQIPTPKEVGLRARLRAYVGIMEKLPRVVLHFKAQLIGRSCYLEIIQGHATLIMHAYSCMKLFYGILNVQFGATNSTLEMYWVAPLLV